MSSVDIIWRAHSSRSSAIAALLAFGFRKVVTWRQAARTRKQLADLPDEVLADIGLTREMALREADRPFWDTNVLPRMHDR